MSRPHVLVVDDRRNMLHLIEKILRQDTIVHTASSGAAAVSALEARSVAVVVCDLRMPDMNGIEVLRATKRLQPGAEFVLMTAYASVPTAIEAMREGAYDYITKPFDPENLRSVVIRALSRAAVTPPSSATGFTEPVEVLPGLVGKSLAMQQLAAQVRRVAATDATTLVLGETGTGKENIARAVHSLGARSRERMVSINCAAIPAELLESEIFGYAHGAFTGAARDRAGLFEEANLGTLFLDEVGEMRLSLQAKLTRAVEERSIRRLGEAKERKVSVRLVAATHRNIEAMVRAGTFREDLWYRLNVAVLRVPPLRDRSDDIELLATHFLRELAAVAPIGSAGAITAEALAALQGYTWPGNVRQLRSAIERASIEAGQSAIDVQHLPPEVTAGNPPELAASLVNMKWHEAIDFGRREAARQYLQAVVKRYQGRIAEAAAHAGVERESFYRLMRKYGVQSDGEREDLE